MHNCVAKQLTMNVKIVTCILSLLSASISVKGSSNCTACIFINSMAEYDHPSCRWGNSTTPCKTVSYALSNVSLTNREIVLQGDQWINSTLTVSGVDGLTIRSSDNTSATINCRIPSTLNDTGAGLVFEAVSNLTIMNVIFERCGTLQYSAMDRNNHLMMQRSAVYIINSTNITFRKSRFYRNVGRGLSLYDVDGHVEITKCEFVENAVLEEEKKMHRFGGGGMSIYLTRCSPGCNHKDTVHNRGSSFEVKDCVFQDNRATDSEALSKILQSNLQLNRAGKGGGISILLKGHSLGHSISIANCGFYNNSARYGGGVHLRIFDYAREHTVTISNCHFENNSALGRSGGALTIGHVAQPNANGNNITVQDTLFSGNKARWGGAVNVYVSRKDTNTKNLLQFINCKWDGNSASLGAAMMIKPTTKQFLLDESFPVPYIQNCYFTENQAIGTADFLSSSIHNNTSHHVAEIGIVDITYMKIIFSVNVSFVGNTGSAIVAKSAKIRVLESTVAEFVNNTASDGGAMALLGFSILELFPDSRIQFDSNHASGLGGALYATSPHQTEFIFSHWCFISYNNSFSHPDTWNTSLIFTGNTAKYGYAIYTDSLLPCAKSVFDFEPNVSSALKWKPFKYFPQIQQYTIATSSANIHFTLPPEISPGERVNIHLISMDDLNQSIPSAYQVILESSMDITESSPYISDDGYLQIKGKQDTEFRLTLQTQNTRRVSLTRAGRLGKCPLGFIFQKDECVCSHKYLVAIHQCDMETFQALLNIGYWVGCNESGSILVGYCPLEYCSYDYNHSSHVEDLPLPKTCEEVQMCTNNRKGPFCGKCKDNFTVYFHSDNYKCGKCKYGAIGILIYIIAELLPLVLLFAAIIIMNVKMTSGVMQSFLTFAQTITLINRTPSFVQLPQTSYIFINILSFLLGFLSLDFFRLDDLSFCLWRGATVLDNLLFHYVTTGFAIFLLGILILTTKYSPNKMYYCQKIIQKLKYSKTPIVHSIATFLILSYTQYTVTSFLILSRLTLYGEGGVALGSVVRLQGNVDYFGPEHLPYAIPAILVLLFLTLPPPLLLISYPLLWKIKASCRRNVEDDSDTTPWLIRKLLPLIDAFQGVFKDNRRMFAGLLLLWRVIIAAIYAFSDSMDIFYFLTVAALFSFFAIHAALRPYKRQIYNIIDMLMFGNMFVISYLSWVIFHSSFMSHGILSKKALQATIIIKIMLMYLPLLLLVLVIFKILQRYNILPDVMQFLNSEGGMHVTDDRGLSVVKKKNTTADDNLFARASELNTLPQTLILSTSETGFELQSRETGQINSESKSSEDV